MRLSLLVTLLWPATLLCACASPQEVARATTGLQNIAAALRAFHDAELRWPQGSTTWEPRTDPEIKTRVFSADDTALFVPPTNLAACTGASRGPCWKGPFLSSGQSLGAPEWLDPWGHPFRYAFFPPGAVSTAKDGAIVLWSIGPDGLDQTGCTSGACVFDASRVARGLPSLPLDADDIVVLVAPALDRQPFTEALVSQLGNFMKQFNQDTTETIPYWPWALSVWSPVLQYPIQAILPVPFATTDTALVSLPAPLSGCPALGSWRGSYLWADVKTMADPAMRDGWGHPLFYAYLLPSSSWGGGEQTTQSNTVLIWSSGADGIDQTGCTTRTCTLDITQLWQGLPSGTPSDDIVLVVERLESS